MSVAVLTAMTPKLPRLATFALLSGCHVSTLIDSDAPDLPPADSAGSDATPDAASPHRQFFNSVNAGGPLLFQSDFEAYVDAMLAKGIHHLHVDGQQHQVCPQCGPADIDIDTEPTLGTYDFSAYFQRLDYAITQKGMDVVLSFNLAGRLASDPAGSGTYNVLPSFFGVGDVMLARASDGTDAVFGAGPRGPSLTKVPRFEKPAVRAELLDYVTAVVTQFRARYGDAIVYYSFTFNTTGENEYPLGGGLTDTSPEAASAFQRWLAIRYATPADVSTAWGRTPAFATFDEIQILDGAAPPAVGSAPRAYLDFMAYRESALRGFLGGIRDRVHAAGGKVMAQYGSVWDAASASRGTLGFGNQIDGFDLVLIDDAPGYDHHYSMDYTRTNSPGVPFGNEADSACDLACASGDLASCCDAATYPANVDIPFGITRLDTQVSQTYAFGATYLDLANWDNFYTSAFDEFAMSLHRATTLGAAAPTTVSTCGTQSLSLAQLYTHHDDWTYVNQTISDHSALGGDTCPIAVTVANDL
jgi:hypothetical protein